MKKAFTILFTIVTSALIHAQSNDSIWAEILNDNTLYTNKLNTIIIHGINDTLDYTITSPGFTTIRTDTINKFKVITKLYKSNSATFTIRERGIDQAYKEFTLPLTQGVDDSSPSDTISKKFSFARAPIYPGNLEEAIQKNFVLPNSFKSKKKGKILVNFSVSPVGKIENVIVTESDFPELNDAAIEAIKKLGKFKPAIQNGNPVKFNMIVPISIN